VFAVRRIEKKKRKKKDTLSVYVRRKMGRMGRSGAAAGDRERKIGYDQRLVASLCCNDRALTRTLTQVKKDVGTTWNRTVTSHTRKGERKKGERNASGRYEMCKKRHCEWSQAHTAHMFRSKSKGPFR
jgi:hypothetical protein